jgi:Tetratricopeptide repeat/Putative Ig domain
MSKWKTYAHVVVTALLLVSIYLPINAADPWSAFNDIDTKDKLVAKTRLEALLLEHPGFYPAHFNLGTILMDDDRDAAANHLEQTTASPSAPLQHDAWYNLALVRFKQGRLEDAMTAANKAVTLQPKNEETLKLRDELRRVALVRANEARINAEAEAKKLKLVSTTLPDGHVGEAYDQHLKARGGAGHYRFALGAPPTPATPPAPIAPGKNGPAPTAPQAATTTPPPAVALPAGMSLDADGRLHGKPQAAGRHDLPIVVNDSADANVHGVVTWIIQPAPAIVTTTLPEAIVGSSYEAAIQSVGLHNPKWTVTGLPAGLTAATELGPQVRITGTPIAAATVTLQVRADDGERHAEGTIQLVASDTFAPDVAILPPATAWAAYTHQLGVRGTPQAYRWSSAGAGGLTCKENGQVTGSPGQAGNLSLPVTIHAADGRSRDHVVTIPVNPPPVIDEATPIAINTKQAINRPLKVTGGTPPYIWNVQQGAMPPGLRLDPDGVVRGSATEEGNVTLTVALDDHWLARTQSEITFNITKRPDDENKDETKKDEQKDQQQDQQQGDQKDQQQADNKSQDQPSGEQKDQQKDQQKKDQEQQGQEDQAQKDQQPGEQGQTGTPDKQQQAEQQAEQRAQVLNQAAADRWLDNLPKEDRDVLRYQLLDGGQLKPRQDGKTW